MFLQKNTLMRAICIAQSLILILPVAPAYASETRTVTCDSHDFKRQRCDVENKGVRFKHQLSASSCREGRDWGYDKRGIWVDNGCEAQFEVTKDSGLSSGEAAAAVLIGGLLLGAMMAGGSDEKKAPSATAQAAATPPNWAIGGFRGRNPSTQRNEDLLVEKTGQIKVIRQGQPYLGQWLNGQQLSINGENFRVERMGGGIRLSQASGPSSDYFLLD